MACAFRVLGVSLVALYDNLFPLIGANLLWFVLTLPVALVGYGILWGVGLQELPAEFSELMLPLTIGLLVLLPNPMAGGIYLMANRLANENVAPFGLFWSGLRSFFLRGCALFAISLLLLLMLLTSVRFYLAQPFLALRLLGLVFMYLLLVWLGMQLYLFPLLVQQSDKRVILVLRNAALVSTRYWLFTLILSILVVIVIAVGVVLTLPIPLLLMSLLALMESRALAVVLHKERAISEGRR